MGVYKTSWSKKPVNLVFVSIFVWRTCNDFPLSFIFLGKSFGGQVSLNSSFKKCLMEQRRIAWRNGINSLFSWRHWMVWFHQFSSSGHSFLFCQNLDPSSNFPNFVTNLNLPTHHQKVWPQVILMFHLGHVGCCWAPEQASGSQGVLLVDCLMLAWKVPWMTRKMNESDFFVPLKSQSWKGLHRKYDMLPYVEFDALSIDNDSDF